jgi:hypothetical protein
MRKKRDPETEEQRHQRFEREAELRSRRALEEDDAIEAMVKRSIEQHGP